MISLRPLFGILVVLAGGAPASATDASVAYVLSVSGSWAVARNTGQDLHSGQGLLPGDVVSLRRSQEKTDRIVVVGSDERIVFQRHCGSDDCRIPLKVPSTLAWENRPFSRMFKAVMSRWYDEESRYSPVSTRGDVDLLFESVVTVSSSDSQLRPVVGDLSPGKYRLIWAPIFADSQNTAPPSVSIPLKIDPNQLSARAEGLKPGLYDVQAFRAESGPDSDPIAEAWVLAAEDCMFEQASASFDEAVIAADKWAPSVSGDTVRRFLRACLQEIAATLPRCAS